MKFTDGTTYEGDWYLGFAHGEGTFTHEAGETYSGEWHDNMRHGKGISKHRNGGQYEGQWFKNAQEGVGVEIFKLLTTKMKYYSLRTSFYFNSLGTCKLNFP